MKSCFLPLALAVAVTAASSINASAADPVFSGPQPGEKITGFKVLDLSRTNEITTRDPVAENTNAPTALVFVHTIERSLVPLLRTIDQYGAERKDRIKTEIVFLHADRTEGEQRLKSVTRSLRLAGRTGLSVDGAEGPGNYGLNKECMMTVVVAKENKVTANFALVQPGITDAPKIIEALARVSGDTNPPTAEQLNERSLARGGANRPGAAMRPAARPNTDAAANPDGTKPRQFPGAVPTDPKLNSLLRQAIRPTNDDARVNELMKEMAEHIKDNPDLTKQAVDGWTRVLHFGDQYGTEHARKVGREFLAKNKPAPADK